MPTERRQARVFAMQALCQWDVQRDESPKALDDFLAAQEASKSAAKYANELVQGFWTRREEVDGQIAGAAQRWDLARISLVERNVMRVAVLELAAGRVPSKVVLDEAIEIGREFGGADSSRFINGVLDEILKRLTDRTRAEPRQ